METIEKDMSSSEESSPMYQRFKQKKLEAERQAKARKLKEQAVALPFAIKPQQ